MLLRIFRQHVKSISGYAEFDKFPRLDKFFYQTIQILPGNRKPLCQISGADLSFSPCYFRYFFLGNHIVNLLSTKAYFIVNLLSTKSTTFSNN